MATWYPLILVLHLGCAIVFVGAVTFEVLVLESLHRKFEPAVMRRIESAVMARARRFMPWVVATLFLSGFALFDIRCDGLACIGSRFGWLLLAKVALAFGVLAMFIGAIVTASRHRMTPHRSRLIHHTILAMMAGIVVLAKLMFY